MTSTTFFIIFIPILSIILLLVNLLLAPHNPYQEKDSPFECGFHSFFGQNRTQFSISFFIFGLLFLLFDLEILLVYPYSVSGYNNDIYGLIIMMIFFVLLTLGFIFELGKNALSIESKQTFSLNDIEIPIPHFFNKPLKNILFSSAINSSILLIISLFLAVPQLFSDYLRILKDKSAPVLEWALHNPPKPHAFTNLPLQSGCPWSKESDLPGERGESSRPQEPVSQEPMPLEPMSQEPVPQEPVPQESVPQEPVPQEPVDQESVPQEPVAQEPLDQEPLDQEPVSQGPVSKEPVPQEPISQEPDSGSENEPVSDNSEPEYNGYGSDNSEPGNSDSGSDNSEPGNSDSGSDNSEPRYNDSGSENEPVSDNNESDNTNHSGSINEPEPDHSESENSEDTQELASQNIGTLDIIDDYKEDLEKLRALIPIAKREEKGTATEEDRAAWEQAGKDERIDNLRPEINKGDLKNEIYLVKKAIKTNKEHLKYNQYGDDLSDVNLNDSDSNDEFMLPFVAFPTISLLITVYKIWSHPIYKLYLRTKIK